MVVEGGQAEMAGQSRIVKSKRVAKLDDEPPWLWKSGRKQTTLCPQSRRVDHKG